MSETDVRDVIREQRIEELLNIIEEILRLRQRLSERRNEKTRGSNYKRHLKLSQRIEVLQEKRGIIQLFLTSGDVDETPRQRIERIDRMARPYYERIPRGSDSDWFRYRRWTE